MSSSQANQPTENESEASLSNAKFRHDIRASLVITKGFCQVLAESLDDICKASSIDALEERQVAIEELETDCRFCLSRITRSLDVLGTRLEAVVEQTHECDKAGERSLQ